MEYFILGFMAAWLVGYIYSIFISYQQHKDIQAYCKRQLDLLRIERIEYEKSKAAWHSYVVGIAGEDIQVGDLVTLGDGLIVKSKTK